MTTSDAAPDLHPSPCAPSKGGQPVPAGPSGWILSLAVFASAFGAMVLEIVAGRLLAPYVGMSLYSWTAIIAVVLAGLSIGHWIGGLIADRSPRTQQAGLSLSFTLAALSAVAALWLIRVLGGPVLLSGLTAVPAILVLTGATFLLPSLAAGVIAPLATKMALDRATALETSTGHVLGRMFALGAVGSILGTVSAGFFFIALLGSTWSVLMIAGGFVLCAILCGLGGGAVARSTVAVLMLAPLLTVGLATGGVVAAGAAVSPCDEESALFCVRFVDATEETGRPSGRLILDHLSHGLNDRDDPQHLDEPYAQFANAMARQHLGRVPRAAFFVGGGSYTVPRAWADAGALDLVVAELDPAVTDFVIEHLWYTPNSRTRILHADARVALEQLPVTDRFEVIFGDAFHDISVPAHLTTVEFATLIRARLVDDGLYVMNVVDAAGHPKFALAMVRTLSQVFGDVAIWAQPAQQMAGGRVTYLLTATPREGRLPDGPPVARLAAPGAFPPDTGWGLAAGNPGLDR